MGKLIICQEKNATVPFFIRCIGKNVYNIEELCFFFYHELYFLEEFDEWEALADWLKNEMNMEELAGKLRRLCLRYGTVNERIILILKEYCYRTEEELIQYEEQLKQIKQFSGLQRSKRRGDYLVHNRKYNQAIGVYMKLLEDEDAIEDSLKAEIYHNLGVAYGKMFYFKMAADAFLKAFSVVPSKESLKQYKLALYLGEQEETSDEVLTELPSVQQIDSLIQCEIENLQEQKNPVNEVLEQIEQQRQDGNVADYYDKIQDILNRWKEECRGFM